MDTRQKELKETQSKQLPKADASISRQKHILQDYVRVRLVTQGLARPLTPEDACIQSADFVSPPKWHLGHTSWFFEHFIGEQLFDWTVFDPNYHFLFNSYYELLGRMHSRPKRGAISRPGLSEVLDYRSNVDERMVKLLTGGDLTESTLDRIELGLNHEMQHQELLLMDVLHNFSQNPTNPAYLEDSSSHQTSAISELGYIRVPRGLFDVGHKGSGFSFDNEGPWHQVFVSGVDVADRLVTNEEYFEFMNAGGYKHSEFWLSDGWEYVQKMGWQAPLYWKKRDDTWFKMGLFGEQPIVWEEPVSHVSYFEAQAYCRWKRMRLPTEGEWEIAASGFVCEGNFLEESQYKPKAADGKHQFYGDLWEWTQSAYLPYPGYQASYEAIGEYNGKFMSGQMVLKGGAFATPKDHIRSSYRNFYAPQMRWQFSGFRVAKDL